MWAIVVTPVAIIVLACVGWLLWSHESMIAAARSDMQEAQTQVGMGRYLAAVQDFDRVPQGAPQYSMAREDATLAQRDSALYRTGKVASSINGKFDNDMQAFWNDYNAAIKDTNRSWDNYPGDTADANAALVPIGNLGQDTNNIGAVFDEVKALQGFTLTQSLNESILNSSIGPFQQLSVDATQMQNDVSDEQSMLADTNGYYSNAISNTIGDTNRLLPTVEADETKVDGDLSQYQSAATAAIQQTSAEMIY